MVVATHAPNVLKEVTNNITEQSDIITKNHSYQRLMRSWVNKAQTHIMKNISHHKNAWVILQFTEEWTFSETFAYRRPHAENRAKSMHPSSYIWPTTQRLLATQESADCMMLQDMNAIGEICGRKYMIQSDIVNIAPEWVHNSRVNVSYNCLDQVAHLNYCNWNPRLATTNQVRRPVCSYHYLSVQ